MRMESGFREIMEAAFVEGPTCSAEMDSSPMSSAHEACLPSTIEDFVRARFPQSERVELCHDDKQVVIHRGWTPIAEGCKPGDGDRVISLLD